jgi:hypothetical protein
VKSKTEINTSELCTNCGLCCDGTLFDDIPISSDDIFMETAESKGYNSFLENSDKKIKIIAPCPLFCGNCSIYNQIRPSICESFYCTGLKKLKAEKLTKDELLNIIDQVKHLKEEVLSMAQQIPIFKSYSIKELRGECFPKVTIKIQPYPELIMKIGILFSASLKLHNKNNKETNK